MKRTSVPKALQERLGDEGTAALVEVLNKQGEHMTDTIVRAIVRELEPRFGAIETRLSRLMMLQVGTLLTAIAALAGMLSAIA